jgi:hypothetical protein
VGRALMRSKITYEIKMFSFAFLHLGDHNINGGVRDSINDKKFNEMKSELKDAFQRLNLGDIILLIDKHFGSHSYNVWHLFKDKSRTIFNKIFENTLQDFESFSKRIYENNYPVMHTMKATGNPLPKAIQYSVEFIVNAEIKKIFESSETINTEKLQHYFDEANKWSLELDKKGLSYAGSRRINYLMELLSENPDDIELLKEIKFSLKSLIEFSVELNVWKAQNILFLIGKKYLPGKIIEAENGNEKAAEWLNHFKNIENYLQVRILSNAYSEIDLQAAV